MLPNGCRFVVGAVQWVDYQVQWPSRATGFWTWLRLDTVCIGGLDAYYTAARLGRLGYAKPECDAGGAHGLYERLGLSDAGPASLCVSVWLKRDLRLRDHAPAGRGDAHGRTTPGGVLF